MTEENKAKLTDAAEILKQAKVYHEDRNFVKATEYYKVGLKLMLDVAENSDGNETKTLMKKIDVLVSRYDKCRGHHFEDVVGLEDFKTLFREGIFSVVKNKELAKEYKVKANCCILLQGPPGTGKSFGIQAAVNEFVDAKLIEKKCSDLVDAYIGNTGKNIDKLFNEAREYLSEDDNNYVVIFIDEIDGIARSRTSDDKASKEAMSSLLVNLTKVDEENVNIIFIGATNAPGQLDAAFLSRFGNNIIEIPLPDKEARTMILKKNLANVDENIDWNYIGDITESLNGRDLKFIAKDVNKEAFNIAIKGNKAPISQDLLVKVIELAKKRRKNTSKTYLS